MSSPLGTTQTDPLMLLFCLLWSRSVLRSYRTFMHKFCFSLSCGLTRQLNTSVSFVLETLLDCDVDCVTVRVRLHSFSVISVHDFNCFTNRCVMLLDVRDLICCSSADAPNLFVLRQNELGPPKFPVPPTFPRYPNQLVVMCLCPSSGF